MYISKSIMVNLVFSWYKSAKFFIIIAERMIPMGLTFDNPNNLNKMLDKFAVVPDPKKSPMNKRKKEEKDEKKSDKADKK
ncbi:hypothetical protein HMPREF0493_0307 [Lactobacillus amylolyticus DSM 11664]|uniref:Uncharacterized protein n=1 Tax=Lactobacillus amylolyticus DSM 11664 TaxID=585524 RepID=D4YS29_9LACO|nr:hypothetical protein HMPREF0493_0307 [Lactobacillus amylolyticus DSM 11664]